MQSISDKKWIILCSIIIFVLAFSIRLYYIQQKSGIHEDTMVTASTTVCNKYGRQRYFYPEQGVIYTGKEIKDLATPTHQSFKKTFFDLSLLRENSCGDYSQPNLYYMLFKIFSFPAQKLDLQTLIHYGCALNLLIFCCSFVAMYKLLKELFDSTPSVIPLGLAVAFLNTGAISTTLLIRAYELQAFASILLTYFFVLIYKELALNKNNLGIKTSSLYVISSAICILSGYFMAIYYGLISLFLLGKTVINKQYKMILSLLIMFILTCVVFLLIYPGYFNSLFNEITTVQVFSTMLHSKNTANIYDSVWSLISHIRFFLFYYLIVIILVGTFFFVRKRLENNVILFSILAINIFWLIFVAFVSPFKVLRYIYPAFPLISLIIPYLVSHLKGLKNFLLTVLIIFIYVFYAFSAKQTEWSDFFTETNGYRYFNPTYDIFSSHIENLYKKKPAFINNPNIPVIFMANGMWQCINLLYKLNDKQKYEFHFLPYNGYRDYRKLSQEGFDKYLNKYKRYYLVIGYTYWITGDITAENAVWQNCTNYWRKGLRVGYASINIDTLPKRYNVKHVGSYSLTDIYLIDVNQ